MKILAPMSLYVPSPAGTRGSSEAQVGARLRLGELHGAGPFAGHELRQVLLLQFRRTMRDNRVHTGLRQQRIEPEGHVGAAPHLEDGHAGPERQALAAMLLRHGHAAPAAPAHLR